MSDFALFEQALAEYETTKSPDKKEDKCSGKCCHNETITENGIISCLECGEELQHTIMHEKEWRYYGSSDSKRSSDPNRVQIRKQEERNINRDVENMGFSETIVTKADELYNQVTKGQIYRGNSRKAIIFACIFHAYKMSGNHQTPENLIKLFGLNRKNGLKGLKIVNVNAPKDSQIHTTFITPVHLIHDIMDKFRATESQKKEVIDLYDKIKNKSSKLNRSRPQSVAAALTYYWICKKQLSITLKEFAKKVDLSELTINKNTKEVALVLGTSITIDK
jgi:transcription initiation factor TFIIIB Brf1 subunit/transcription initiation factor TFIIB|tara:strand:+ start:1166 stop:1999 length:834 start_codon:yes stop_codon:yes gene_type:complete